MGKYSKEDGEKRHKNKKQKYQYYLVMEGNHSAYYQRQININFGPKKLSKKKPVQPHYPTFNKDNKYYTPTFYMPEKGEVDEEFCYENHHKKQANAVKLIDGEDQEEFFMPKPSRRHDYCGVCRKNYTQYVQHIDTDMHKNKLEKSLWQKELCKMAEGFIKQKRNDEEKKEDQANNELTAINSLTQNKEEI